MEKAWNTVYFFHDPLTIVLGSDLLPLVKNRENAPLFKEINEIRKALGFGKIRIIDNPDIDSLEYQFVSYGKQLIKETVTFEEASERILHSLEKILTSDDKQIIKWKQIIKLEKHEKEITEKIYAIDTGEDGLKAVADGIINVENYITAKYKILWILKEAYTEWYTKKDGTRTMGGYHLCNEWYNNFTRNVFVKSALGRREIMTSQAILSDISDEAEAFKRTAVIEIKKIPNGMTKSRRGKPANWDELQKAYDDHKDILLEQIAIYNPDVVICGNTLHFFKNDLDYKKGVAKKLSLGNDKYYYCFKDRVYINTYHPSYPKVSDKEYIRAIYNAFLDWCNNYRGKECK